MLWPEVKNTEQLKTITHLITVSCTGMAAPGLDLMVLERLKLPLTTHRTSVTLQLWSVKLLTPLLSLQLLQPNSYFHLN